MGTGYLKLIISDGKEESQLSDLTPVGLELVKGLAKNLIEKINEIENED
jgi:hypothetical protein